MPVYKKAYISLIILFVTVKTGLHLLANSNYGYHADELLYLAMADHMAWGYQEVSPVIAGISWLSVHLFGSSLFAMRILPTLAGALLMLLTGLMTIEFGGKRFAITLACMGVLISPSFLASGYFLQPIVFDQLFWCLCAFLLLKYTQTLQKKYLLWLGIAAGFGILTKYSIAVYLCALLAGLLLTRQRKLLRNRYWLNAIAIAGLICLPNVIWQISNGLPLFQHVQNIRKSPFSEIDAGDYLLQVVFSHGPALSLWSAGLFFLMLSPADKVFRFFSIAFILTVLALLLLGGKFYYSFGAFPVLFAAGGKCWEMLFRKAARAVKRLFIAVMIVPALLILPAVVPILPFNLHLNYFELMTDYTPIRFPITWEDGKVHKTTQFYADMLGWQELAAKTAGAYYSLGAANRSRIQIVTANYGQAGAIHYYGKQHGLPEPFSANSSFRNWVKRVPDVRYIVYIGKTPDQGIQKGRSFKLFGTVKNEYAREKGTNIWIATIN